MEKYTIPPVHREMLAKLLYDVTEILTAAGIHYWIDGGTLLGCVRHCDQIPWDDDVDLGMMYKDYTKKLPKLKNKFLEKGYLIQQLPESPYMYKVFIQNKWMQNDYRQFGTPTLDIFPWKEKNDNIILYCPKQRLLWKNCIYKKTDLFPLKEWPYRSVKFMGANNPFPYLDSFYPEWNIKAIVEVRKDLTDKTAHETFYFNEHDTNIINNRIAEIKAEK
jgi:phosphorylcholine metabolism protein LicD